MKIGEAARATGLTSKSIRYYESLGLVQAYRADNGYRDYGDHQVQQLTLLARARKVGFSLDECRELLTLLNDCSRHSADVKQRVQRKIRQLDHQLHEIHQMRTTLAELASRCAGDDGPECAILDNLSATESAPRFQLVEDHNES